MDSSRKPEESRESKDRVKVFIRWRPCYDRKELTYNITDNNRQLHIPDSKGLIERDRWYKYDYIFSPLSSNKEVYKVIGHPLVQGALNGFNSSLFAYGQTGSGKTHTLMSKDGLTAHMVSLLFSKIWNDVQHDYKVTCSYLQIYQEKIYDLLNVNPDLELKVREDPSKGPFVENMISYVCHTPTDVYELLNVGRKRLVFAETRMNRLSSRSHSICQIHVEKKKKDLTKVPSTLISTPVEISSPRASECQMPELSELEFETIPCITTSLKKRHSIAVSMPTKRNSSGNIVLNKKSLLNTSNSQKGSPRETYPISSRMKKRNSVQLNRAVSINEKRLSLLDFNKVSRSSKENKPCLSASSSFRNLTPLDGNNRLTIRRSSRPETPDVSGFRQSTGSITLSRPETPDPKTYDVTVHSNTSLELSRLSYSTDSVIEDMDWQMNASTADISKIFEDESSTDELLNLSLKEEESSIDDSKESINKQEDVAEVDENIIWKGKMSIVDLAGSERIKKSQAEGDRLLEAQHINSTLHELGNVISALAKGSRVHVPYRNSTLTRLLQDSIGGNCKTSFILCNSGAMEESVETKCTLEFGKRLLMISSKPKVNIELDYKKLCDELKIKMKEAELEYEKQIQDYRGTITNLQNQMKMHENNEKSQNKLFENFQNDLKLSNMQNEKLTTKIEELIFEEKKKDKVIIERENELFQLKDFLSSLTNKTPISTRHVGTNTAIFQTVDTACNTTPIPSKLNADAQTSPLHSLVESFSKSCNTSPVHDAPPFDTEYTDVKLRNVLLTELMSLQLLYSMLELNFNSENTKSEFDTSATLSVHEGTAERNSPVSSSKSSGYITGSQSQLEIEKKMISDYITNINVNNTHASSSLLESPLLAKFQDSYTPNKGGLLEEIIETQLAITKPESTSSIQSNRMLSLKKEIAANKSSIDKELILLTENLNISEEGKTVNSENVYSKLVHLLTGPNFVNGGEFETTEQLEHILNLVLVDHSLTGCLLALSNRRKTKSHETMMRRLSSFKSTPKSLLDYIDIDEEMQGYENEAVVFQDDNENDLDSEDGMENYCAAPDTPELVQKRNDILSGEQSDSDEGSDMDSNLTETSSLKKKGIRRFLCMPIRSKKSASKKAKPFKKSKKQISGARLLECED